MNDVFSCNELLSEILLFSLDYRTIGAYNASLSVLILVCKSWYDAASTEYFNRAVSAVIGIKAPLYFTELIMSDNTRSRWREYILISKIDRQHSISLTLDNAIVIASTADFILDISFTENYLSILEQNTLILHLFWKNYASHKKYCLNQFCTSISKHDICETLIGLLIRICTIESEIIVKLDNTHCSEITRIETFDPETNPFHCYYGYIYLMLSNGFRIYHYYDYMTKAVSFMGTTCICCGRYSFIRFFHSTGVLIDIADQSREYLFTYDDNDRIFITFDGRMMQLGRRLIDTLTGELFLMTSTDGDVTVMKDSNGFLIQNYAY